MYRTILTLLIASSATLAFHDDHAKADRRIKELSRRDIVEKLDGKKTTATMVEVTLSPGQASAPHRHPGPVFGYVIEGEYEWAIDDKPARKLKAGETFYEPTGCLHRVSKNPSDTKQTRLLAVLLHSADVKEIVIPEKGSQ
jgi:quercetin dioxygenase-like cupin family protein